MISGINRIHLSVNLSSWTPQSYYPSILYNDDFWVLVLLRTFHPQEFWRPEIRLQVEQMTDVQHLPCDVDSEHTSELEVHF